MRRYVVALGGLVCAAPAAVAQSAPPGPWYLEASGGAIMRMNATRSTTFYSTTGQSGPGTNTATFSPGYDFNFGVGYKLP